MSRMLQAASYPGPSSSYEEWQSYFNNMRVHLKELAKDGKTFLALQYICTVFLLFFSNFTEEFSMMRQAKTEEVLREALRLQDQIQIKFNAQSEKADAEAAKDALTYYYGGEIEIKGEDKKQQVEGLQKLLKKHGPKKDGGDGLFSKEFVDSVEAQFPIIFCDKTKKEDGDGSKLAADWHALWEGHKPGSKAPDSKDPDSKDPDSKDPDKNPDRQDIASIQPVSNALSAVVSHFSSQSSIVQSHLKLYEANDEQWQSMAHSMMKDYIDVEKHSISLQHGA